MYMILSDCKKGDKLEIIKIKDGWAKEQVIRFGLLQGAVIICLYNITNGPVVIKRGNQIIAIGYPIASKISVKRRLG